MKNMKLISSLGAVALLVACSDPRPPEEIVAERAQARWDAMIERDFRTAWQFYAPGFRQETPVDVFTDEFSRRPVRWIQSEILDVSCAEKRCETTAQVEYSVPSAPGELAGMQGKRNVSGVWIEIDGEWWYSSD